jgi:GDP-L-fucose synthase
MFYKDKKVLVTGGTGFVGTNFVQELVRRGAKVRVPVHFRPMLIKEPGVEVIKADLSKPEDCLAVCKGMDYVVNAAGAVSAAAVTNSNPMGVITNNLVVAAQMLQAAWTAGVQRFLVLGSTTVYPAAERPIKEDEMWGGPTYPTYFAYGWMRRYLERLSEFVHQKSSMKIALVRPTAVYGPFDDFHPVKSHVIPALIRKAVDKMTPYEVWGTGDEVRDFLYVSDMVEGGLLAMEKAATCDPINLGYGKAFTIKDVVRNILKETGHEKVEVKFDSSKPVTIPFRMVDTTKAKNLLGFEARVSLEDGIRNTIKWYRDNPEIASGGHH